MGKRAKRNKPFWQQESFSFGLTLVTVSIIFIFIGYLLGQYAVQMISGQRPSSQQTSSVSISGDLQAQLERLEEQSLAQNPQPQPTAGSSSGAEQRSAPPANTNSNSASGGLYRVQAGAFSQKENADRLAATLRQHGYETITTSGPPYRVQLGAFSERANAQRLADELITKGFEAAVIR